MNDDYIQPTGELVDDTSSFFAPVASDLVDSLVAQYESSKQDIVEMAELASSSKFTDALGYFVNGNLNDERHGIPRKMSELFGLEGAIAQLNAAYWAKAFALTDVYDHMPQVRRNEWNELIRNPAGVKANKQINQAEVLPLPVFEAGVVRETMFDLLNNRPKFFAERVDGIFRALSKTHVTNQPEGYSKRLILSGVINDYNFVDSAMSGFINDLRCVIAKFMGRDEPHYSASDKMINDVRRVNGEWRSVDGGALRIRIYNGVGTAHLEVHPDMAWRLNAVLASLYPSAIPSRFRQKPKRSSKAKDIALFDKPLPFKVIGVLSEMSQGFTVIKQGFRTERKYSPCTLIFGSTYSISKAAKKQAEDVLLAIGGTFDSGLWVFDYEPASVIGEIVCSGCIPDHKSHQYYPTPEIVAKEAIELASMDAEDGMKWLEPSAGTGNLAELMPQETLCVEVSKLHCEVLKAKDLNVLQTDFLKMKVSELYDRIVMNPPFSEGRWMAHLEHAARMLKPGGRIVAILPSSASGKTLIEGLKHTYSRSYSNEFAGTSASVIIVTIE